jgi:hypothetical protein
MSLNWNMTKVDDLDALHAIDGEWAKSEALIWCSMAIGLGGIDEGNWAEFYARIVYVDRLIGYTDRTLTAEDVHRRIGLYTNVSDETKLQFIKRWSNRTLSEVESVAKQDLAKELKLA